MGSIRATALAMRFLIEPIGPNISRLTVLNRVDIRLGACHCNFSSMNIISGYYRGLSKATMILINAISPYTEAIPVIITTDVMEPTAPCV